MIATEYLAQFNPMRRAKIEAALDKQMRLDGRHMFRWQVAELLAADAPRADNTKGRLYHGADGCFYDVSSLTQTCDHVAREQMIMWLHDIRHKLLMGSGYVVTAMVNDTIWIGYHCPRCHRVFMKGRSGHRPFRPEDAPPDKAFR